jgi:hypothetical protein
VLDALGRCVLTYALPAGRSEADLPVQHLGRGMYTLQWKTASALATGKLLIE